MSKDTIEREDIILYVFTLLLISGVGLYLYLSQENQMELIRNSYAAEVPKVLEMQSTDSLELAYYKAQVQQTNRIAGHSARALIAVTTIRHIGFLVGITMIFIGAIMIIRGIRNMPTEVGGNLVQQTSFKIASSSPGILFSFFGTLIVIATLYKSGDVTFGVEAIRNYQFQEQQILLQPEDQEIQPTEVPEDTTGRGQAQRFFGGQ